MPLPNVAQGALIGGGVGLALAVVRRPGAGESDPGRGRRVVKSVAEGALAGAAVGLLLDRSLRRRAVELLTVAPTVVDAVTDLAQRYEPVVERFAEHARERAVDAYESAYGAARPIVADAYARALELRPA